MTKRFQVEVLETGVKAVAELLEEDTPRTCAALWKMLGKPIETNAVHAMWSGREVMAYVPEENRGDIDPTTIGVENATVYPVAGDVVWAYFPGGMIQGFKEDGWIWRLSTAPRREYTSRPDVPNECLGQDR